MALALGQSASVCPARMMTTERDGFGWKRRLPARCGTAHAIDEGVIRLANMCQKHYAKMTVCTHGEGRARYMVCCARCRQSFFALLVLRAGKTVQSELVAKARQHLDRKPKTLEGAWQPAYHGLRKLLHALALARKDHSQTPALEPHKQKSPTALQTHVCVGTKGRA